MIKLNLSKISKLCLEKPAKKFFSIAVPAVCAASVFFYILGTSSLDVVYMAKINGKEIGYVESPAVMELAKTRFGAEYFDDGQDTSLFDTDYELVHKKSPELLDADDCARLLEENISDDYCLAYVVKIDGDTVAANRCGESLEMLLYNIKAQIAEKNGISVDDVRLENNLEIERKLCSTSLIRSVEEINSLINPPSDIDNSQVNYTEVTTQISALSAAAPVNMDGLAGNFKAPKSLTEESEQNAVLELTFVKTETITEVIYFDTVYIDDYDNFIGNDTVVNEGVSGSKTVTYEITYGLDGKVLSKNAIVEKVISAPIDKVVKIGAVQIPDAVPTGTFIWPCDAPRGISSYYGWRDLYGKRDFHLGVDMPDKKGSPIYASDGGEVIWAGYSPSYGYSIRIKHSNGYETLYAHLEKMHVGYGDSIYQGQHIADMGSTGVAYGVHLHFEVRLNGNTVNPIKYLPKR